jgi:hypothetical protein
MPQLRSLFIWILCGTALAYGIGALMLHRYGLIPERLGFICLMTLVGLAGDIMLSYTFLGNQKSWLFRWRTRQLFGETFCRAIEGSLGVLSVCVSLFFLFASILFIKHLVVPGGPSYIEGNLAIKLIFIIGGFILVLAMTGTVALLAFQPSSRPSSAPAAPEQPRTDEDGGSFQF